MIAPSGLYRIPRADSSRDRDEARRFARLEYGSPETAWMVSEDRRRAAPRTGLLRWIGSLFRGPRERPTASRAPASSHLGSSVAGVHLVGDEPRRHPAGHAPHGQPLRVELAPSAIALPVRPADSEEDLCECPS